MKRLFRFFITAALVACTLSCSNGKSPLPDISGRAGELIVVATKDQWGGEAGNAIREVLGADYGYLPQEEPAFDLLLVPKEGVNRLIKTHRNMLYLNVADTAKAGVSIRRDVWSAPQMMVIVSAPDIESATNVILENRETIYNAFENAERGRNMTAAKAFENMELRVVVNAVAGGSPSFPDGYFLKKNAPGFIWISYETNYTTQGVFIYSFPIEEGGSLSAAEIIRQRDRILGANVPATTQGSYMITNPLIVPEESRVSYNGIDRLRLRGLWDTYNDFMGGPFILDAFPDTKGENIMVVEGFVYAPKFDKRNYLRQMDAIVSTFAWEDVENGGTN